MDTLNTEEFYDIARNLESYHSIFERLWAISKPVFNERIPTAAVSFDRVGECILFEINPKFWATLTPQQKLFIVAHECMHVILYHGFRINNLQNKTQMELSNLALDVVVNHALVNKFLFDRKEVDPDNKLCWADTVFDPKENVSETEYFEFYYNKLIQDHAQKCNCQNGNGGATCPINKQSVDDHGGLPSFNNQQFEDAVKEVVDSQEIKDLTEYVQDQTQDINKQCRQAGCSPGNAFKTLTLQKPIYKKKWETVIKRWVLKHSVETQQEQWTKINRRYVTMSKDFLIPSENDVDDYEANKMHVWFFQDTSGSCDGFIDRFFAAARSLPPGRFIVHMHCFDTQVYKTTLESGKLYGFGGTSFSCIEQYIQKECKNKEMPYPKAVFIITDGYGDTVKPQHPERWHWFIDGSFDLIPEKSPKYNLKDFE